jgi:hypothetical protein
MAFYRTLESWGLNKKKFSPHFNSTGGSCNDWHISPVIAAHDDDVILPTPAWSGVVEEKQQQIFEVD